MATPCVVTQEVLESWRKGGMPADIDAPQGGRIMTIRSQDRGLTWSKPETILNRRWDEGPQGMKKLSDGTVLVFVNNQASWYGLEQAPKGHLSVNTRSGVMRSEDNGRTWSDPIWLDGCDAFYQRAYAQPLELPALNPVGVAQKGLVGAGKLEADVAHRGAPCRCRHDGR